jgi:Fe-S cluster assembly scaffold protein SufB
MNEDYKLMLKAYQQAGGKDIFNDSNVANLVIHKNKVLGKHLVQGLIINTKETDNGVDIDMTVKEDTVIDYPVHLCFGILPKEGKQEIKINVLIKKGAKIKLLAHCVFPNAIKVQHIMDANYILEENASLQYDEVHYHGTTGGIEVIPHAKIKIGKGSRFLTSFLLMKGRVGKLDFDYQAEVDENGILEMMTNVYGYEDDLIKVSEGAKLFGDGAKGLIKSRIAVRDNAKTEVISEMEASAPHTRGHVDCIEIIQGKAEAKAIPIVNVLNEKAQVTHEASVGRVNQKELETLMSRGLKENEAIDIIVRGMLN